MHAVVYQQYGPPDVLHLAEVDKPSPGAKQILVRVRAADVTSGDCRIRGMSDIPLALRVPTRLMFGITRPRRRVLGGAFAGDVEAVGEHVTRFSAGDRVFGFTGLAFGAYAEYLCMDADKAVTHIPTDLSYEAATAAPFGGLSAAYFLRTGELEARQRILIVGASGAVGAAAVQLATHAGASVTGVCSTPKVEYVRSLGADGVIDYMNEDIASRGGPYDAVLDTTGRTSFAQVCPRMTERGRYLLAVFGGRELLQMLRTSIGGGQKVICGIADERLEDLESIQAMIEAGNYQVKVDRTFPLAEAAAAHEYAESGKKVGAVVLTVG